MHDDHIQNHKCLRGTQEYLNQRNMKVFQRLYQPARARIESKRSLAVRPAKGWQRMQV